jgi:hypothetical protein
LDTPLGSPHAPCVPSWLSAGGGEPDLSARYAVAELSPGEATGLDAGRRLACAVAELPLGPVERRLLAWTDRWTWQDRLALAGLIEIARAAGGLGGVR